MFDHSLKSNFSNRVRNTHRVRDHEIDTSTLKLGRKPPRVESEPLRSALRLRIELKSFPCLSLCALKKVYVFTLPLRSRQNTQLLFTLEPIHRFTHRVRAHEIDYKHKNL